MFKVTIKSDVFDKPAMSFLIDKNFKPNKEYMAVGFMNDKLVIADEDSGEMIELFPRNCVYLK